MNYLNELFWRIRYVWHFRKETGFKWSFCWSAAMAAEYEEELGYTPREAVLEELSYWDGE